MVRQIIRTLASPVRGLHEAAYVLAAFALLSQVLALVRDRLLAGTFGAHETLDLYYAAFRIPDFLFATVASLLSLYALMPVLSRLEAKVFDPEGRSAGLNLTRATLDAAMKYPWPRRDETPKFGYYDDDKPVFDWLRLGAFPGEKCVEAQIMDWADDVAYSVHDLEDGVQAGIVVLERLDEPVEREALVRLADEVDRRLTEHGGRP